MSKVTIEVKKEGLKRLGVSLSVGSIYLVWLRMTYTNYPQDTFALFFIPIFFTATSLFVAFLVASFVCWILDGFGIEIEFYKRWWY